ncbi:MAG: DUF4342 domain-containing protein [Balneolaceae bacterium]|nr:DUF4342 domain-containing protein [Balneolaceae bacterium]
METSDKTILQEISGTLEEIIAQVKKLIKEGNARRVYIKNKSGKTLFESQLTIGAAGAAFFVIYAPILTALTTIILMANDVTVLVEREMTPEEKEDEYEVEAEIIEIKDEDDEESEVKKETDKTVGKKGEQ